MKPLTTLERKLIDEGKIGLLYILAEAKVMYKVALALGQDERAMAGKQMLTCIYRQIRKQRI